MQMVVLFNTHAGLDLFDNGFVLVMTDPTSLIRTLSEVFEALPIN